VCGGLADGRNRFPRENDTCDCPEGWEGINCNGNILKKEGFFYSFFAFFLFITPLSMYNGFCM
jgi:hypothetical protein